MPDPRQTFIGAKLMVFVGDDLIVLERDHTPGISWPGCLDFPGGGREGDETPIACVLRETREELGLNFREDALEHAHLRDNNGVFSWYFATHQPKSIIDKVRFGNEGAGWCVMPAQAYVDSDKAIPHFAEILAAYMKKAGSRRE